MPSRSIPAIVALVVLAVVSAGAAAQAGHDTATPNDHAAGAHQHAAPAGHGPYAGMHQRTIKALSEQQLADLRAGKGMSLALPAELNGYPGPSHALELADQLGLSEAQRSRTQALFGRMQHEAKAAGEDVIAAEAALDRLFRSRRATPAALREATAQAAQAQGRLRETHLRYHLAMVEVLSPQQVDAYNRLRGY